MFLYLLFCYAFVILYYFFLLCDPWTLTLSFTTDDLEEMFNTKYTICVSIRFRTDNVKKSSVIHPLMCHLLSKMS